MYILYTIVYTFSHRLYVCPNQTLSFRAVVIYQPTWYGQIAQVSIVQLSSYENSTAQFVIAFVFMFSFTGDIIV